MKKSLRNLRVALCAAMVLLGSVPVMAQYLRTSYFMDGVHFRQQLNPSLSPDRGYLNLPVVGSFNASVSSNTFGVQDMMDIAEGASDADYFMSNVFMSK